MKFILGTVGTRTRATVRCYPEFKRVGRMRQTYWCLRMKPSRTLRIYRGTLTVASIRPITGVMRYLDANGLVCCRRYRDRPSPQYACMFLIFFSSLLKRQGFRISVRFMYRNITALRRRYMIYPRTTDDS